MRSNLIRKQDRQYADVDRVMSRIRQEAKTAIAAADIAPRRIAKRPSSDAAANQQSVLYSEELNYLNANWHNWNPATEITSHRPIVGKLIVKLKRFFVDLVWNYLLKGYFERERNFQMHLVKYLNANARYIDSRNADLFWQLIDKVDNDIASANERIDQLFDHAETRMQHLERETAARIEDLERTRDLLTEIAAKTDRDLAGLDEYTHDLDARIAQLKLSQPRGTSRREIAAESFVNSLTDTTPDQFFAVGARSHGSESRVKAHLREFVEYFIDADGPVVDFGCERGEFLELLNERKIKAVGLSFSAELAKLCQDKGLSVEHAGGAQWLAEVEDQTLGGIFTENAVNFLSAGEFGLFLELASRKIRPGGRIVMEVANPQSLVAFAQNQSTVPHHSAAYQPDVLRMLVESFGLRVLRSSLCQSFESDSLLQLLELDENLPGRWHQALKPLNDNLDRLNGLLFGHKSYVIVAEVQG
jgi:O-antigen chain-terminating methyltransferase